VQSVKFGGEVTGEVEAAVNSGVRKAWRLGKPDRLTVRVERPRRSLSNPDEPEPKQGGNWKQETENGKPEMKNGPDRFPVLRFPFPVFCFSFFFSGLLKTFRARDQARGSALHG
jgi:hypothetical protein